MQVQNGSVIRSTALLNGTNFEETVIVISEHNENGSIGYVFNQLFPRKFNELMEFKDSIPVPLYVGGPVQTDQLYFMHCRPDLVPDGTPIDGHVFMGGDFKKAVQLINSGELSIDEVRLFIGYCGWDLGELEEELAEGSWELTNAPVEQVFTAKPEQLWQDLQIPLQQ